MQTLFFFLPTATRSHLKPRSIQGCEKIESMVLFMVSFLIRGNDCSFGAKCEMNRKEWTRFIQPLFKNL